MNKLSLGHVVSMEEWSLKSSFIHGIEVCFEMSFQFHNTRKDCQS